MSRVKTPIYSVTEDRTRGYEAGGEEAHFWGTNDCPGSGELNANALLSVARVMRKEGRHVVECFVSSKIRFLFWPRREAEEAVYPGHCSPGQKASPPRPG